MQFPEVSRWLTNLTSLVSLIGASIFLVAFVIAAIMLMTSFGNEHRNALAKAALFCAVAGLLLILIAPQVQNIVNSIVNNR